MQKMNILVLSIVGIFIVVFSGAVGFFGGFLGARISDNTNLTSQAQKITEQPITLVDEDSSTISVVEQATKSVVSVVISKDLPVFENESLWDWFYNGQKQIGTEEQQVGAGTGFVVSTDGMIITNRHVVEDESASYTVVFTDGTKHEAKVLARDTLLDIAFLKIEASGLLPMKLGTSENLKVGQRVIAIGNALGEFNNSVSTGIISGLSRNITATDQNGAGTELLSNVIQTDASINFGNSGGPLLDIQGNVIGVNVARAEGAENIGFAIPIDTVKDLLSRIQADGTIERPVLGVRFQMVDESLQKENKLPVDYGAIITRGEKANQLAVLPGSPADKAGIVENDIILEINGVKVDSSNPLQIQIQQFKINDTVTLKILRKGETIEVKVKLEKF